MDNLRDKKEKVKDRVTTLYEEWLLDNYSDEIHGKDDWLDAVESQRHWDKFLCWMEFQ